MNTLLQIKVGLFGKILPTPLFKSMVPSLPSVRSFVRGRAVVLLFLVLSPGWPEKSQGAE